jgi:Pin2-interacting protein X1
MVRPVIHMLLFNPFIFTKIKKDAERFGQSYLAKLGWDPSKGLGSNGDGRTSHINVSQKMDMLGIGAAQKKDGSSIAWKQNQDFENVLKRLNESLASKDGEEDGKDDSEQVVVEESPINERKKKRKRPRDGEKAERKRSKSKTKRNEAQDLVRAEECSVKPAVAVHAPISRLRRYAQTILPSFLT